MLCVVAASRQARACTKAYAARAVETEELQLSHHHSIPGWYAEPSPALRRQCPVES
jgi:hypothetical protein